MRPLALLTKLLVLVSLVLASVPSGATETVCVLGNGKVVRPVAKCGMPCCAKKLAEPKAPEKRSCCAPKKSAPVVKGHSKVDPCVLAGRACRCETRLVSAPAPSVATVDVKATVPVELPVAMVSTVFEFVNLKLELREPGIVGNDSGPPPKVERSSEQPRAPPVFF